MTAAGRTPSTPVTVNPRAVRTRWSKARALGETSTRSSGPARSRSASDTRLPDGPSLDSRADSAECSFTRSLMVMAVKRLGLHSAVAWSLEGWWFLCMAARARHPSLLECLPLVAPFHCLLAVGVPEMDRLGLAPLLHVDQLDEHREHHG